MPATDPRLAPNRACALWFLAVVVASALGCMSSTWVIDYAEDGSGVVHFDAVIGKSKAESMESGRKDLEARGIKDLKVEADGDYRALVSGTFEFAAGKPPGGLGDFLGSNDLKLTVEPAADGSKLFTWETSFHLGQAGDSYEDLLAKEHRSINARTKEHPWLLELDKASAEEAHKMIDAWPKPAVSIRLRLPGAEPVRCDGPWTNATEYMAGKQDVVRFSWEYGDGTTDGRLVVQRRLQSGVEVLDANPKFLGENDLTELPLDRAAEIAAANPNRRQGAVADGASYLLLRRQVPGAGRAELRLVGEEPVGSLFPLGTDPAAEEGCPELTVDAVSTGREGNRKWWVFALYAPPDALGTSRGPRDVHVKLHFVPTEPGKDELRTEGSFKLIRPPVVLVHGTFDRPKDCWDTISPHSGVTMKTRLVQEALRVSMVDWEETNGKKDPSSFASNATTVRDNPGGIANALEAVRKDGFAATQADLVCHSQGGVIARVYAKGHDGEALPDGDLHNTDPRACQRKGLCWYHHKYNFGRGDIHRLITVSTTHMGSDNCRALVVYHDLKESMAEIGTFDKSIATLILLGAGFQGTSGLEWPLEVVRRGGAHLTGGVLDQLPGSQGLRAIGRTRIPSHAIACTCEDEDMMEFDGLYQGRYGLLWGASTRDLLVAAWTKMGQPKDAEDISRRCDMEAQAEKRVRDLSDSMKYMEPAGAEWEAANRSLQTAKSQMEAMRTANARRLRAALFGNCPNDATVREESSKGGLPDAYTTSIPRVLHGYAPTYSTVQERVVTLLLNDGSLFCKEGFPPAGALPTNREYTGPVGTEDLGSTKVDPSEVTVPNVVGMSAAQAKATLLNARLAVAFLASGRPTPDAASEGNVESTSPSAGDKVKMGSSVTLHVYGPYTAPDVAGVTVPDVAGLSAGQAMAALVAAGFQVRFVAASGPAPEGCAEAVDRTVPAAGQKAPRGSQVTVYVFPR